jgi:DNA-binding Lrp family transcriptional regulator
MMLDNIDKQLINILSKKGRETLTDLKDRVQKPDKESMSHSGVRKRIRKLEDNEIIKVQGNINIASLGYQAAFILMEMKNYIEVQKVVDAYKSCPRVFMLAQVTGQYNLLVGVLGQSIEILRRFINLCGPTNKDGILHSAVMFVSQIETPEYMPTRLFGKESFEHKCGNICDECEAFTNKECLGCGTF